MRFETAKKFWSECLQQITSEEAGQYIENPAVLFVADAKAGKYDAMSDEEYNILVAEMDEFAGIWDNQNRKTVGNLLLNVLERITIPSDQLECLAGLLAKLFTQAEPTQDADGISEPESASVLASAFAVRPPKTIRDTIARCVIGQSEAVKAAAMITYHHLSGRRSTAVFCGPSGCGKSEIWRCLSKEYPGLIRMVDFSRFAADGWRGSLHLRDIFDGVRTADIRRRGLIVVLDEADKIICERVIGGNGTDYNALVQNSLLKMLEGDTIEFGAQDNMAALSIDCSKVSVVLLGAFERLLDGKAHDAKHIGFGAVPKADAGSHKDISYNDLINAGMRRELAGRINKIVALEPLSLDDYKAILEGPVLSGVQKSIRCRLSMDNAAANALAEQAIESKLGARWMWSALLNVIDNAMFDSPKAKDYRITIQDCKLCCQAQSRREGDLAEQCVFYTDPDSPDLWMSE